MRTAGLVGSSNNPVSGITIATILFAAVVLMGLMGRNAELGPVAAIMIGAVVCCAACISGDNLQDLKCGHMIGATPWRQQTMLAIGAATSALVMGPVLNLRAKAYGIFMMGGSVGIGIAYLLGGVAIQFAGAFQRALPGLLGGLREWCAAVAAMPVWELQGRAVRYLGRYV